MKSRQTAKEAPLNIIEGRSLFQPQPRVPESAVMSRAARHRGDNAYFVARFQLRSQAAEVPDVLAVDVDVDEVAEGACLIAQPVLDAGVGLLKRVYEVPDVCALRADLVLALREPPERSGDLDVYRHSCLPCVPVDRFPM